MSQKLTPIMREMFNDLFWNGKEIRLRNFKNHDAVVDYVNALESEVETLKSLVERLIEAGDKMADDFEDAEDDRRSSNEWLSLVAEWRNWEVRKL